MSSLTSHRLSLQLATQADLAQIHQLLALPETDEFNVQGIPADEEATWEIISPWIEENTKTPIQNYSFTIQFDGAFIGLIGLKLGKPKYRRGEVWYKIFPKHWNKGLTTEALNRILDFGFEDLGLHRIEAGCAVKNSASIRVMEKVGMQREGESRSLLPLKSGWSNTYTYAILEGDERL